MMGGCCASRMFCGFGGLLARWIGESRWYIHCSTVRCAVNRCRYEGDLDTTVLVKIVQKIYREYKVQENLRRK